MAKTIALELQLDGRKALAAVTLLLLCWHPALLNSETLTLTTYYPAPYGGYVSLLATSNATMARDSGMLTVGSAGTIANLKLVVDGTMQVAGGNPAQGRFLMANDNSGNASWGSPLMGCFWQAYAYGTASNCSSGGYAGKWTLLAVRTSGSWQPPLENPANWIPWWLMLPYKPIGGGGGSPGDTTASAYGALPTGTLLPVTSGKMIPESGQMLCCMIQ